MKNRLNLYIIKPDYRYSIGAGKYQKEQYQKRIDAYNLNPKHCLQCDKILDYKHVRKNTVKVKFCCHSCAATFTNKARTHTTKGVKKTCQCVMCNENIEVSIHVPIKSAMCNKCKVEKQNKNKNKKIEIKNCLECKNDFSSINGRKTCSDACKKISLQRRGKNGGDKSIFFQNSRSKNEIYFYELCEKKFSNVLNNKKMFNGWDADIILVDLKIAVLWNGVWHYKTITKKHSLLQVQNRDRIKMIEIEKCGFIPYVIKDMGKHDKKKVEMEFDIFCKWLIDRK